MPPTERRVVPIRWRIILPFAFLTTTASALVGWAAQRRVAERVERDIRANLDRVVSQLAGAPLEPRFVPFMARLADARLVVLDAGGTVLASSLAPDELAGWRAALSGGPPPENLRVGTEAYLAASAQVSSRGFGLEPASVVAAVPRRRVTETQRAAAGPLFWVVAAEGLAAIAIGIAVASSLTRPLGRLAAHARRIASGDLSGTAGVRRHDEIGLLAETLDGMVASLRRAQDGLVQAERMAAVGRIAAGLAHEIRNPLSSIRMHVQLMAKQPGVDAATRDLVLSEIDRLDGILSELLAWARPTALTKEPVDLGRLVEEALALFGPQLAHRGIRIVREIAAARPVAADAERLRQVLRNLLANARDALGTGGAVTVRLAEDGAEAVLLEVADDGPGIPAEIRDRVFEPFVTGRKDGTGLGLAIVKRAVEEHGGTVAVETGPGGTRFRMRLPKHG